MRVLRRPQDIEREIASTTDPAVAQLLTRQVEFMTEDESEESLTVVIVEPGDTLEDVDAALNHQLLEDGSERQYDDPGFIPCFETLIEHPTFYEMFLVGGGEAEMGTSVLIPKSPDTDQDLLALCVRHAVQPEGSS